MEKYVAFAVLMSWSRCEISLSATAALWCGPVITGPAERGFVPQAGGNGRNRLASFLTYSTSNLASNEDWTGWAEKFIGAPFGGGGRCLN